MKTFTGILAILIVLFISACKNNTSTPADNENNQTEIIDSSDLAMQYFQRIFLPNEEGIFRNTFFDQSIDSVKVIEASSKLSLAESSDDYLQYEEDLFVDTANGIDYATVKYIFDSEDRLWIVTINYYVQDSSRTNDLFDILNEEFTAKYNDYYIDSDGYTVWESSYKRPDSTEVVYDLGIRKLIKFEDPGIQIELMRFGTL